MKFVKTFRGGGGCKNCGQWWPAVCVGGGGWSHNQQAISDIEPPPAFQYFWLATKHKPPYTGWCKSTFGTAFPFLNIEWRTTFAPPVIIDPFPPVSLQHPLKSSILQKKKERLHFLPNRSNQSITTDSDNTHDRHLSKTSREGLQTLSSLTC